MAAPTRLSFGREQLGSDKEAKLLLLFVKEKERGEEGREWMPAMLCMGLARGDVLGELVSS